MDDDVQIQGRKLFECKFAYEDPDFFVRRHPTYNLTITYHRFRARRRLVYLRFLMRRPRGRKMLKVQERSEQMTFYGVTVNA